MKPPKPDWLAMGGDVAPRAGARIETGVEDWEMLGDGGVAPRAGARIETGTLAWRRRRTERSPPVRGRGLKPLFV